jgi:hypothetical protein
MTRHKTQPHRTLLHTVLPVLFLILIFLVGPAWAACSLEPLKKIIDKGYSGIDTIVLAKAGPVLGKWPAYAIADGFIYGADEFYGETVTYDFSVEGSLKGNAPEKIEVSVSNWKTINNKEMENKDVVVFVEDETYLLFLRARVQNNYDNAFCSPNKNSVEASLKMQTLDVLFKKADVDKALGRLHSELLRLVSDSDLADLKNLPVESRSEILKAILKKVSDYLERITKRELKDIAELVGLLTVQDESLEEVLFDIFNKEQSRITSKTIENKVHWHRWNFLLAYALSSSREPSVHKAISPILEYNWKTLKEPYSFKFWAMHGFENIGTPEAKETRLKVYSDE